MLEEYPDPYFLLLYFLFFYIIASCQMTAPKEDPKNKDPQGNNKPAKPKKVILNSGENLYAEIRDMNFSAVGPVLSREAKRITAEYEVCIFRQVITQIKHIYLNNR